MQLFVTYIILATCIQIIYNIIKLNIYQFSATGWHSKNFF